MGEWVIGALINIVGSIAINFGTNLLKLGHDQVCIYLPSCSSCILFLWFLAFYTFAYSLPILSSVVQSD